MFGELWNKNNVERDRYSKLECFNQSKGNINVRILSGKALIFKTKKL